MRSAALCTIFYEFVNVLGHVVPVMVSTYCVEHMSLSRMAGEYGIMKEMDYTRLKRRWHYPLKCSFDWNVANEESGSIDAILRAWPAYGGQPFLKSRPQIFFNALLLRWRLVRSFVVSSAKAIGVTGSLWNPSSHSLQTKL